MKNYFWNTDTDATIEGLNTLNTLVGFWEDIAHSTASMLLSKAGTKVDKGELKIKQIYLTKR